jgi:hypothetical protein
VPEPFLLATQFRVLVLEFLDSCSCAQVGHSHSAQHNRMEGICSEKAHSPAK